MIPCVRVDAHKQLAPVVSYKFAGVDIQMCELSALAKFDRSFDEVESSNDEGGEHPEVRSQRVLPYPRSKIYVVDLIEEREQLLLNRLQNGV